MRRARSTACRLACEAPDCRSGEQILCLRHNGAKRHIWPKKPEKNKPIDRKKQLRGRKNHFWPEKNTFSWNLGKSMKKSFFHTGKIFRTGKFFHGAPFLHRFTPKNVILHRFFYFTPFFNKKYLQSMLIRTFYQYKVDIRNIDQEGSNRMRKIAILSLKPWFLHRCAPFF